MYYKETWLDKLDRKFGRHAVPNLMTILTVCTVTAWVLDYIMYFQTGMSFSSFLVFSRDLIFQGQVWRVFTFLFLPPSGNLILSAFMLYFYWMIGSALEREWGDFRFNLYYLFGFLGAIIAGLLTGYATSEYINLSLFLAFAILNPNYPVRLFFLIPIPVKFLAIVDGAVFGVAAHHGKLVGAGGPCLFLVKPAVVFRRKSVSENQKSPPPEGVPGFLFPPLRRLEQRPLAR